MINGILNIIAPVAKEVIGGYLISAISNNENINPVKKENPYSSMVINTLRNYNAAAQVEEENRTVQNEPVQIPYQEPVYPFTTDREVTPYTIAKNKSYKYTF